LRNADGVTREEALPPPSSLLVMVEGAYGTVTVVPSPVAVMENVPALLDVYV